MGNAVADSNSDANQDNRFRLLQDEEGTVTPTPPVPLPQGSGEPPKDPPLTPPQAAAPEPEPKKQAAATPTKKVLEQRVKQLEQENEELLCALYHFQQQVKDLRGSK